MVDNNLKADPSIGQSDNTAVEKVDKNAPFSLAEAEAVVGAEEGHIEEAIEKQKREKSEQETRIAPDLIELKKRNGEEIIKKGVYQRLEEDKELRIDNQYYLKNRHVKIDFNELSEFLISIKNSLDNLSSEKIEELRRKI